MYECNCNRSLSINIYEQQNSRAIARHELINYIKLASVLLDLIVDFYISSCDTFKDCRTI